MQEEETERTNFAKVATVIGASTTEVQVAWQELQRRGLVSARGGTVTISPLAMRRATSDVQRRVAAHLSGYVLTENAFIVRRAGDPPGLACVLNSRITVEQIANYFKEGWGVTEMERDLIVERTSSGSNVALRIFVEHGN